MKKNVDILEYKVAVSERKRLFRIAFAKKLAKSMPPFKAGLSSQQKRELIRKHVCDVGYFDYFLIFNLDKDDIYSITCQILAEKYGLNNP